MTVVQPGFIEHGSAAPSGRPIELAAGPVRVSFEPWSGVLRHLRVGGRDAVWGVYAAVRDRNWGTVAPAVSELEVRRGGDAFTLRFSARCHAGPIDFLWRGVITGDADGTVRFEMDGEAANDFLRNRIGFCVLHPATCAGDACRVEHIDGSEERAAFPRRIAPHQPFTAVRAITHEAAPGVSISVRMEGDTFETEDQRNWTDASFKTYCTPLDEPFPVAVARGIRVRQSVTVTVRGKVAEEPVDGGGVVLTLPDNPSAAARPLPAIGLEVSDLAADLSGTEWSRLAALNLSHLRVELRLGETGWRQRLARAAVQAQALGAALEPAVFVSNGAGAELAALAEAVGSARPVVARWLIYDEDAKAAGGRWAAAAAREALSHRGGAAAPIVSGTHAYFAELNRERPPMTPLDGVCFSINPQVHATDDVSLVETLPMQGEAVRSAAAFSDGRAVIVSPITLKPRFNPNATGPEPAPLPGELPAAVDPRQMSLFAAGWTLGSLAYLAQADAVGATWYQTIGWLGVMERAAGSPLPQRFPSIAGAVFPLYHVLADAGEFAGGTAAALHSSRPLTITGLALWRGGARRVVLANHTDAAQSVVIRGVAGVWARRVLASSNAEHAMVDPSAFRGATRDRITARDGALRLDLPPYAVATLDDVEGATDEP